MIILIEHSYDSFPPLVLAAWCDTPRWVSAGYDRFATLNFLEVFQGVVRHPNTVTQPRILGSEALSRIVAATATALQYTNATEAQLVQVG